jgi:transaldolase
MKIYVASAKPADIRWATENGLADGVLTAPGQPFETDEDTVDANSHEALAEICRTAGLPVLATVSSVNSTEIYRDGRELAKISDLIHVQIPLVEDAVGAIGRLRSDGVRVVATLVYSAAQAVLAAKAGAFMVSVSVDQLDLYGHDGADVVRDIVSVFSAHATECDVMASLPQHAAQFARCARAGADVIAVTPEVLRSLLVHPLTDRGLDQWLRDLSSRHRTRATA